MRDILVYDVEFGGIALCCALTHVALEVIEI